MYVVAVYFDVEPEYINDFSRAVLEQADKSLELEEGCHTFDVCQTEIQPADKESQQADFFLYELYSDERAFSTHLETEHFKTFNSTTSKWVKDKRVVTYSRLEK